MSRAFAAAFAVWAGAAWAVPVEVPVDVGVGPAAFWFLGPMTQVRGAVPHFGLQLDVHAIIDKEVIDKNRDRIPPNLRGMAEKVTEARISPSIFIPRYLYVSPKLDPLGGVGMYGISWVPFGLILASSGKGEARGWDKPKGRGALEAGLLLTYFYVHSDRVEAPATHFIRPGLELKASVEAFVTPRFLVSLSGGGQAYVPQKMGEFGFGPFEQMICFAAFASLQFHYRFPYTANL